MPTSAELYELYEVYVVMRSWEQAVRDALAIRYVTSAEIDKDVAYCEAVAEREWAYKRWVNAWKGYGYA